jgi:glycosyltransferase involved in cell wall biosynthesis
MQLSNSKMKPRVVFIIPWQPYPLYCGGALRAFHLARQMGSHFDTTVIFPIEDATTLKDFERDIAMGSVTPKIVPVAIPNGPRSLTRRIRERWTTFCTTGNWAEPSNNVSLALLQALENAISEKRPDLVVLTEIETLICSRFIRRRCPDATIIADMHNVNHTLHGQYIANNSCDTNSQYQSILDKESSLVDLVDHVFTCSKEDLAVFQKINDQPLTGTVVSNGVDTRTAAPFDDSTGKSQSKELIYCASLTTRANIDGLNWFYSEIWPRIQEQTLQIRLNVVGRGHDNPIWGKMVTDPSVRFSGRVAALQPHYASAGVSICPLRIGSGTRLKILEAMSFGNPIVSTALGCEGIGASDGEQLVIRDDPQQFAAAILELLENESLFDRIRTNARNFVVERYDWDVVGRDLSDAINKLTSRSNSAVKRS